MHQKSKIEVAVGIIIHEQQVLLALRPPESQQGGLWEFPGGKIENHETSYQALCRELIEELGIDIELAYELPHIFHQYDSYQVQIYPWVIKKFSGLPTGCEGQYIQWINLDDISNYQMPAANQAILKNFQEFSLINRREFLKNL